MKKILTIITAIVLFMSCDENKETIDSLSFPDDAFITFSGSTASVGEASTAPVTLTVLYANSSASQEDVTIDFTTSSTNGTEGTDYTIVNNKSSFTFSPANGVYSDTVQIMPIDNVTLGTENVVITFTLGSSTYTTGYPGPDGIGKSVEVTILDDDCAKEEALRPYQGTWTGDDNCGGYTGITITTELPCGTGLWIRGVGYSWLQDPTYWDEIIIEEHPVFISIDATAGTVSISSQLYVTTTWNGNVQPTYNLVGAGTIDTSGAKPVIHLEYDLVQPAGSGSMVATGGTTCGSAFVTDFTLD
ncbi:hypothetical protein [Polaribacter sp.]|uniref:hypothetical protein n=1 Tax=Polaribacter sp. TaxID=1920175 RepID=UPI003EF664F3